MKKFLPKFQPMTVEVIARDKDQMNEIMMIQKIHYTSNHMQIIVKKLDND